MSLPSESSGDEVSGAAAVASHKRTHTRHADPFAYLTQYRTDTHALAQKFADATIIEETFTQAEIDLMEELRRNVGAMLADPAQMVVTAADYPGGMHQHWTNYWPEGKDHPLFVDRVSALDADPTRWPQHELIRFLRARDMNLKRATKMYFSYRRWRIVWGASHIGSFPTAPFEPLIQSILSHQYHKHDARGRPLYVQRSGLIDPHRFVSEVSLEQIGIGHTWFSEEMRKRAEVGSRIAGKRVDQLVNIIDIRKLSLSARKLIKIFSCTTHIDQYFYPETLGTLYLVGAPAFFPAIFSLCKPFLSAKTQEKVKILGKDFAPTLAADLGVDCLPVEYGGVCECEGGCCPLATGPGFTRPGEEGATEEAITVKAGATHVSTLAYAPTIVWSEEDGGGEDPQEAWWTVELEAKDVDFKVEFVADDATAADANTTVVPTTRVDHSAHAVGTYSGAHRGVLHLTFSNEYSRWNSKSVKLRTGLRPKMV